MPTQQASKRVKKEPGIRISGDPELFIARIDKAGARNRKKVVPVCGLIGGTKEAPIPIPGTGFKGFMMQEDGVALEINFPAASDSVHFAHYVGLALAGLETVLTPLGLAVVPGKCSHEFTLEELAPYSQAKIVGCSPDTDAYTRLPRSGMNTDMFGLERYAAGHFHISFPNPYDIPPYIVARMIDLHVTLAYLALDKQGNRRKHYGLAGLYRPTKYPDGSTGIEYRTMSNFWVFSQDYRTQLSSAIINLITDMNSDIDAVAKLFDMTPWQDVKHAIDTENIADAQKLWAPASDFVANTFGRRYVAFQNVGALK